MLTAAQILELVKGGEGYNVDFKLSTYSKIKEDGCSVLIGIDKENHTIESEIDEKSFVQWGRKEYS